MCGKIANHAPRSTLITPAPWIGSLAAIVLALMPRGKGGWWLGVRAKPADLLAGRRVADRAGEEHAAS